MSYSSWVQNHYKKHKEIVKKLISKNFTEDEIIEYFDFDNMKKNEIDFCPLYKKDKKCHNIEKLNCYICACPNFRFNDNGLDIYDNHKIVSRCNINNGEKISSKNGDIHQNCTNCTVPHHKSYVKKHFNLDWLEIVKECEVK